MILQRLAEHYDRITSAGNDDQVPMPGFSLQKISFCVVLEPDGRLNSFQSLQEQSGKRLVARQLNVPGQSKPSGSGVNDGVNPGGRSSMESVQYGRTRTFLA